MKIAITGGTGFIGSALVAALTQAGHSVRVLTRRPESLSGLPAGASAAKFDAMQPASAGLLDGIETVIHLAGEPIAQRWTTSARARIVESRVQGTRAIVQAIVSGGSVQTLISASAIGYYGPRGDEELDEVSAPGTDFVADICKAWEAECQPARDAGRRVTNPRIGVVLHPAGGALQKMLPPFKLGVGGRIGSGDQWMSWIHRDDLIRLFLFLVEQPSLSGPVNATAPSPVTNRQFTQALGHAIHRPTIFPVPSLALKAAFGEMSTVLLTGQRVVPKKALAAGFRFEHPTLDDALAHLLSARAA